MIILTKIQPLKPPYATSQDRWKKLQKAPILLQICIEIILQKIKK